MEKKSAETDGHMRQEGEKEREIDEGEGDMERGVGKRGRTTEEVS